ncbi:MAG: 50S ribosomal protein L35ae [Candidatus Altiarchaeota archaeon]|nr:50S ribosomal protein L35ae [Candidatus Altiarchaeota archaeon]
MEGIIINYRQGRETQNNKQMVIRVASINSKQDAEKLIGKLVIWKTSSGKILDGVVLATHGNKGAVRAKFDKGLPGQSVGTQVEIIS